MKKVGSIFLVFMMILCSFTVLGTEQASTANFLCNANPPDGFNLFHPTSGSLAAYYDTESDIVSTAIAFRYTATAVGNINTYNDDEKYTGIDIKCCDTNAEPADSFDAYSISTTAPNPKKDIEISPGTNYYNEAEIVILGELTANQTYSMSVYWIDHRIGVLGGKFYVNAELSQKGVSDYNVLTDGYKGLTNLAFSSTKGQP